MVSNGRRKRARVLGPEIHWNDPFQGMLTKGPPRPPLDQKNIFRIHNLDILLDSAFFRYPFWLHFGTMFGYFPCFQHRFCTHFVCIFYFAIHFGIVRDSDCMGKRNFKNKKSLQPSARNAKAKSTVQTERVPQAFSTSCHFTSVFFCRRACGAAMSTQANPQSQARCWRT